jgi:type II secretory ATPase GspE/PulE/Tfp pilus assembly ATPase PilB-like protein
MLCPYCKRLYQPSDVELAESGFRTNQYREHPFYSVVGCDACNHTGYRGRTAIHELLESLGQYPRDDRVSDDLVQKYVVRPKPKV